MRSISHLRSCDFLQQQRLCPYQLVLVLWGPNTESVLVTTLDELLLQTAAGAVAMAKIDAEGSDALILRGARAYERCDRTHSVRIQLAVVIVPSVAARRLRADRRQALQARQARESRAVLLENMASRAGPTFCRQLRSFGTTVFGRSTRGPIRLHECRCDTCPEFFTLPRSHNTCLCDPQTAKLLHIAVVLNGHRDKPD